MDVTALLVFAAALFVAAVSPGPGVAAILARVLGRGAGRSVVFTAGLAFGDVVWLAAAVGGLAVLAQNFQMVFLAVKWIGVAYLLYLAWKMWTSPPSPRVVAAETRAERPVLMFLAGLAVTLGNPKTMVFYLALLPNLIDIESVTLLGFLELAVTVLVVLAVVFGGYILLAARARSLLTSSGSLKLVNRVSAGAMAGAATWVATR